MNRLVLRLKHANKNNEVAWEKTQSYIFVSFVMLWFETCIFLEYKLQDDVFIGGLVLDPIDLWHHWWCINYNIKILVILYILKKSDPLLLKGYYIYDEHLTYLWLFCFPSVAPHGNVLGVYLWIQTNFFFIHFLYTGWKSS